jgi:hypothetical protein
LRKTFTQSGFIGKFEGDEIEQQAGKAGMIGLFWLMTTHVDVLINQRRQPPTFRKLQLNSIDVKLT